MHHALHVLLTGENQGYYADFDDPGALTKVLEQVFLHDGTYSTFRRRTHGRPVDRSRTPGSRFVVSLQTHDQVGNRAMGDRLSSDLSPGLLACGAALLLTGPGTPMLFMGEEWGATTPWQYFTDHTDPEIASAVRTGGATSSPRTAGGAPTYPIRRRTRRSSDSKLDWSEPDPEPHASPAALVLDPDHASARDRRPRRPAPGPGPRRARLSRSEPSLMYRGDHVVAVNLSQLHHELAVDAAHPELEIVAAWSPERHSRHRPRRHPPARVSRHLRLPYGLVELRPLSAAASADQSRTGSAQADAVVPPELLRRRPGCRSSSPRTTAAGRP